jgi:hypothetical protein
MTKYFRAGEKLRWKVVVAFDLTAASGLVLALWSLNPNRGRGNDRLTAVCRHCESAQ